METTRPPAPPPKPAYPTYRSEDLFAQAKVVLIVHGGREYQLRITSTNRLILTA